MTTVASQWTCTTIVNCSSALTSAAAMHSCAQIDLRRRRTRETWSFVGGVREKSSVTGAVSSCTKHLIWAGRCVHNCPFPKATFSSGEHILREISYLLTHLATPVRCSTSTRRRHAMIPTSSMLALRYAVLQCAGDTSQSLRASSTILMRVTWAT